MDVSTVISVSSKVAFVSAKVFRLEEMSRDGGSWDPARQDGGIPVPGPRTVGVIVWTMWRGRLLLLLLWWWPCGRL